MEGKEPLPLCGECVEMKIQPPLKPGRATNFVENLVPNYPVITAITAVITVVLVFWVRKRQMGGNAVTLRVHLLQVVSGGNYRLPFYIQRTHTRPSPDSTTNTSSVNLSLPSTIQIQLQRKPQTTHHHKISKPCSWEALRRAAAARYVPNVLHQYHHCNHQKSCPVILTSHFSQPFFSQTVPLTVAGSAVAWQSMCEFFVFFRIIFSASISETYRLLPVVIYHLQ